MQLILDDEIRWGVLSAPAEERTCLEVPNDLGELVYRADEQRRYVAVNLLIYRPDRQSSATCCQFAASRLRMTFDQRLSGCEPPGQLHTAARTSGELLGPARAARRQVERVLKRQGRCCGSDPEPDADRCFAEVWKLPA